MDFKSILPRIKAVATSSRGRDALVFTAFLGISVIMWAVMALSEEAPIDLRMPLRLTKVPDSATVITRLPNALNVTVRTKGAQRVKLAWYDPPALNLDFNALRSNGVIHVDQAELTALARTALGNSNVQVVSPDSLHILYTLHPGLRLPVRLDCRTTVTPQSVMRGLPHISTDSVMLFSASKMPDVDYIATEPLRLNDLSHSVSRRVKLLAPPGCRVIPDSITVSVDVEPLIMKTRKVVIEPVNVPSGIKLITFPAQVDVAYMMPMTVYKNSDPQLRVVADYNTLDHSGKSHKIRLRLRDVPEVLRNVHLSTDSAEFVIERL